MLYEGKFIGETLVFTGCSEEYVCNKYVSWLNDPQINQYLESRYTIQTTETVLEYVKNEIDAKDRWLFAMLDKETNRHVGNLHLTVNPHHNVCYPAFFIGDVDQWGRGRSLEINRFGFQFAFEKLGVDRIEGSAYKKNFFSVMGMLRSGMIQEGVLRKAVKLNSGERDDCIVASILREEYQVKSKDWYRFEEIL